MKIELTVNGEVRYLPESERERAMDLYWTAKENGDKTAAIMLVERTPNGEVTSHLDDTEEAERDACGWKEGGRQSEVADPQDDRQNGHAGNGHADTGNGHGPNGAANGHAADRNGADAELDSAVAVPEQVAPLRLLSGGADSQTNGTKGPAVAPSTMSTIAGALSALAAERIQVHESWIAKAGFALPPPLYAPGTRVTKLGDDNFRIERERVERMPLFPETARRISEVITREAREDMNTGLKAISFENDGGLTASGRTYDLELGVFHQLATIAGFGMGARYLSEKCWPDLRALNANRQFMQGPDKRLKLRTRDLGRRRRVIYAAVTPSYIPTDTDEVLQFVEEPLRDAHTEAIYDGSGVRATALFMPDEVVDLAAGDVFKVGVRLETDDTGRGRIRVAAVAYRNRCLNLLIIAEGEVETVSLVHRGDPDRIREAVRAGVTAAREKVGDFLAAWGHARTIKVDPVKTLRTWVEEKKIQVKGLRDHVQLTDAFLTAWQKEPGDTLADAVNAVSRAAHEHPLFSVDIRQELERQAGRLLYVAR